MVQNGSVVVFLSVVLVIVPHSLFTLSATAVTCSLWPPGSVLEVCVEWNGLPAVTRYDGVGKNLECGGTGDSLVFGSLAEKCGLKGSNWPFL